MRNSQNGDYTISVNEINEGVAIFRYREDGSATLEYANRALQDMMHFDAGLLLGATYAQMNEAVHPEDRQKVLDMLNLLPTTERGECVYRIYEFQHHDMLWFIARGKLLKDDRGPVAYFTFSDITAQHRAIEREKRLAGCLELLTSDEDWEKSLSSVMRIVQEQYASDRVYIFEMYWERGVMSNTYEYVAAGVTPEIDNLKELPIDMIRYWLKPFKAGKPVYIDDLSAIRDDPERKEEYDILAPQGITSLMTLPIIKHGELFGYVGVDNPRGNSWDKEFLSSIAYFLSQEFFNRRQQQMLIDMSLKDALSHMNNRHAYMLRVQEITQRQEKHIGVVFADVNGLKYVNDHYGHLEGDKLICRAAEFLMRFYPEHSVFRISGDEFVVLSVGLDREHFDQNVRKLEYELEQSYGSVVAIGTIWEETAEDILKLVNVAEERMYVNKKEHYRNCPEHCRPETKQ